MVEVVEEGTRTGGSVVVFNTTDVDNPPVRSVVVVVGTSVVVVVDGSLTSGAGILSTGASVGFTTTVVIGVVVSGTLKTSLNDQGDLEFIADRIFGSDPDPARRARNGNSVMATVSGDQIVTIGTTDWVFGLATDPQVAQITRNALSGAKATRL